METRSRLSKAQGGGSSGPTIMLVLTKQICTFSTYRSSPLKVVMIVLCKDSWFSASKSYPFGPILYL